MKQKSQKSLTRVLILAGGTGGHVFPGLAVADYLRQQGVEVHWLGTRQGLESRLVPEANFPLHLITIGGLRGKGIMTLLKAPFIIFTAILASIRIIKKINPDLVIGMGGFVSGPAGIASWFTRRPLIIHEQNAIAGLTNKVLAHFSRRVLEGFPGTFKTQAKVKSVGNPVRTDIANLPTPQERFEKPRSPLHLLVLGGSLGAQALNEMVPPALANLPVDERPLILHQTGEKQALATQERYASLGLAAEVKPFIKDMAQAYKWADMVLCRAGALTVSELCVVGLGGILVPFPQAADDHQTANAQFMVKNDAAICVQQAQLTTAQLTDIVRQFYQSPDKRLEMAKAAYQLRKVQVAEKIYEICKETSES